MKAFFTLLLAISMLAACGFSPVYKNTMRDEAALRSITVDIIPNREGVFLRNALMDRLYKGGTPQNPLYTLSIAPIAERQTDLDITRSSDVTRTQLQLSTTMRLIKTDTSNVVLSRPLMVVTSTNVLASEFANRVSETDARFDALKQMAEHAERILALHFKTNTQ